jgi:hypothetical protein
VHAAHRFQQPLRHRQGAMPAHAMAQHERDQFVIRERVAAETAQLLARTVAAPPERARAHGILGRHASVA